MSKSDRYVNVEMYDNTDENKVHIKLPDVKELKENVDNFEQEVREKFAKKGASALKKGIAMLIIGSILKILALIVSLVAVINEPLIAIATWLFLLAISLICLSEDHKLRKYLTSATNYIAGGIIFCMGCLFLSMKLKEVTGYGISVFLWPAAAMSALCIGKYLITIFAACMMTAHEMHRLASIEYVFDTEDNK